MKQCFLFYFGIAVLLFSFIACTEDESAKHPLYNSWKLVAVDAVDEALIPYAFTSDEDWDCDVIVNFNENGKFFGNTCRNTLWGSYQHTAGFLIDTLFSTKVGELESLEAYNALLRASSSYHLHVDSLKITGSDFTLHFVVVKK
jgi:hypothetical protein